MESNAPITTQPGGVAHMLTAGRTVLGVLVGATVEQAERTASAETERRRADPDVHTDVSVIPVETRVWGVEVPESGTVISAHEAATLPMGAVIIPTEDGAVPLVHGPRLGHYTDARAAVDVTADGVANPLPHGIRYRVLYRGEQ